MKITYPAELPVSERREDLLAAISENQVVIVAGETGSGKTTQLPKMCLELGRGTHGLIGHTQPRRLAARTVAERIAAELQAGDSETASDADSAASSGSGVVGYQIRFTDRTSPNTQVKLMTDGILLAEIQQDKLLSRYDTIIIDEAHERSLNIDFLLGYLKNLLPRRPDLKLIITSATIDPERFSRHFGEAPIVEVSGRTYPVEVRYRPLVDEDGSGGNAAVDSSDNRAQPGAESGERDQIQGITEAAAELMREGSGDILVFLSGEREIRDTAEALEAQEWPRTEILPLYARLSHAEQKRVFQRHQGRRIVLATNVAETSLTIPGIHYVIDAGIARISRYSHRTKVQRLPIEPISQASANQRKGRCGRVAEGVCIRLYSEQDFLDRPEFTDPEIVRTNLASVIVRMADLGLGDIESFPFPDPPDRRQIRDGLVLLEELGALKPNRKRPQLTSTGRQLARLPLDPRLGRMVIEAARNGCVQEVVIIAAALSIQDPRERPTERQEAADQQHARFRNPESDFLAYLAVWDYLRERQQTLSGNQFRKMCRAEFLNYLRVREWQDLVGQLRQIARESGIAPTDKQGGRQQSLNKRGSRKQESPGQDREKATPETKDAADRIHQSLLAGLLSHVGLKDEEKTRRSGNRGRRSASRHGASEYFGARNSRFAIFPGSALAKKPPRWVMASELVETTRLWARGVARIQPEWVEKAAGELVKRNYSEPHWEKNRAAVVASETVTLYGIPLAAGRKVNYSRIEPELCRELFIRHALVEGDWDAEHAFLEHNRALLAEVEELEQRSRRSDLRTDDETLFDFYDQRIPADVISGRHFDAWWRKARAEQPELLDFDKTLLLRERSAAEDSEESFPDSWQQNRHAWGLTYRFDPGSAHDGVTVNVPVASLNQVSSADFSWQIPGLRAELIAALLKTLPKQLRRNFVPVPDFAEALTQLLDADSGSRAGDIREAVTDELRRMTGVSVPVDAFDSARLPEHLRMKFSITDEQGEAIAEGHDLEELRLNLQAETRQAISAAGSDWERSGITEWDFGELPQTVEREFAGNPAPASAHERHLLQAYPALVDDGDSVSIRLLDSARAQRAAHARGIRRLLLLSVDSPLKQLQRQLSSQARLRLAALGGLESVLEDCLYCALDKLVTDLGGPVWTQTEFAALRESVTAKLGGYLQDTLARVEKVVALFAQVKAQVDGLGRNVPEDSRADMRARVGALVYPGFATATGWLRLSAVHRYLQALAYRAEKASEQPARDQGLLAQLRPVWTEFGELCDQATESTRDQLTELSWMFEEYRVSLFAQHLGTAYPISESRLRKAMAKLR